MTSTPTVIRSRSFDVTQPDNASGQVVVFSRDEIQFSPAPLADEGGQANARFTYTVSDGNGHEVAGEVTITVLPEPLAEPPFARDDSTFTFVDVPVTVDVLRNDGDPSGGRPTLSGRPGCPSGGQATVTADRQVRYDPPPGSSGAFRCTYEVTNARGLRASASIIVSVREPQVTNQAPQVVNDRLTVAINETASINVIANDTDPDGDDAGLELVSSTAPTLGTATRAGNTITFTAGPVTGDDDDQLSGRRYRRRGLARASVGDDHRARQRPTDRCRRLTVDLRPGHAPAVQRSGERQRSRRDRRWPLGRVGGSGVG